MKSHFVGFIVSWLSFFVVYTAAEVHYHDFVVQATPVERLCKTRTIITVNGQFPGPTLEVMNGDTLIIKVTNRAIYNATLHWHGVRQMRTGWADGPAYITQCPIRPGGTYTYRFTITEQEGTLWWHAHISWLRATVYGALIIYPRQGTLYPFPKPDKEFPIILGEWWNANPLDVVRRAIQTGAAPNISNAYTINGQPGDLYNCSSQGTTVIPVFFGETNLLRFINAAMNNDLFVTIANHPMTVVGLDSAYTKPFTTSVILLGPGQTIDVLVTTNQPPGRYYIAARAYAPAQGLAFDNTTTTAILDYKLPPAPSNPVTMTPLLPRLPAYNDTTTFTTFIAGLKCLTPEIPGPVDTHLFFTVGLGLFNCAGGSRCGGPNNTRFAASESNVSFVLPSKLSMLQAHYLNIPGIFTSDFPAVPVRQFDYTAQNISRNLWQPFPATKALSVKYGAVIQLVIQDTNIVTADSHPMHIHGYEFYILASGFGNYDKARDASKFNLVDPPKRNTVNVPVNGWAVIRFRADNPGVWLMHCHLDVHLTWGLATTFAVENGVGELETLEPPPADLPVC